MARLIALIWLKFIYFKRQFRNRSELADRAVGFILWALGILVSVLLAIAIGKLATRSLNAGEDVLRVSFYIEFYVFSALVLGLMFGGKGAQVVMLFLLVAALAALYTVLLGPAAELLEKCKESLIETISEGAES